MRSWPLGVALVLLAGCGSQSEASGPDPVCGQQSDDLEEVRALAERLSEPDSRWLPGEPQSAADTAGEAVSVLAGYAPDDPQVDEVAGRAREAVEAFYEDLGDGYLDGAGQSADTARAALGALDEVCRAP